MAYTKEQVKEMAAKAYELDQRQVVRNSESESATTSGKIANYTIGNSNFKYGTQLFGLPFQFLDSVDKRIPSISSSLGRKYVENIAMDAPVVTIIPGKPKYLPGAKDKVSVTNALITATNGDFSALKTLTNTKKSRKMENLKLYDFQTAYIEYYQYANLLCRTAAGFLELDTADKNEGYRINGKPVNFARYDWKGYRWDSSSYNAVSSSLVGSVAEDAGKSILKAIKGAGSMLSKWMGKKSTNSKKVDFTDSDVKTDEEELNAIEDTLRRTNYLQFYLDPSGAASSVGMSNSTQQSVFKQTIDGLGSNLREIQFLIDSGGGDSEKLEKLGTKLLDTIQGGAETSLGSINESTGSIISRLLSSGKSVIRGDSIMMPDIWGGSDMGQSHTLNFHYKAPYGNKLCQYVEVLVPVLHWIALAYPHATTPNSYSAPYLIKCYVPGSWTVSLGLITSLEITKDVNEGNVNTDGLYTEVDVSVTITELYSDMAISPANDMVLFMNNSSLVEFLATNCGLSLIEAQLDEKAKMLWNQGLSALKDIPSTVGGKITEKMDDALMNFIGL